MMEEALKPETPLRETGVIDAATAEALAGHWITTVEQFLLRAASAEAREQMAEAVGIKVERVAAWREELLRRLPAPLRGGLESPPPPGPRPGMGLWLKEGGEK